MVSSFLGKSSLVLQALIVKTEMLNVIATNTKMIVSYDATWQVAHTTFSNIPVLI